MKILRRILVIILGIALVVLSIGFILPGKIHVERNLLINAPQKRVFEQLNTLKNWKNWSPWLHKDSLMQLSYSGPESGTGATYSWLSKDKNIGNGSLSILESSPADSMLLIMDFGENGKSTGKFVLLKENQNTHVFWSVDSELGLNPLSRWFGLFSDRLIGPDLELGLYYLDDFLADLKAKNKIEIFDYEVPARILLTVRDTASSASISLKLSMMYQKLSRFLKSNNLSPTGSPIAIFHNYTDSIFDMEACLPIVSTVKVSGEINCIEKNAQKTVMTTYFGNRKLIGRAYQELYNSTIDRGLRITGPAWEEYVTDPLLETDTLKWQTNIYYPVE